MPVIPGDAINLTVLNHTYLASHKRDIGKQSRLRSDAAELHSLLTGNYIRNRTKMKQDTWQHLHDNRSRPIDKDGIFLGQYG